MRSPWDFPMKRIKRLLFHWILSHDMRSFTLPYDSTMMWCLSTSPKEWANQYWIKIPKTVSQNKLYVIIGIISWLFLIVRESWLIKCPNISNNWNNIIICDINRIKEKYHMIIAILIYSIGESYNITQDYKIWRLYFP